MPNLLYVAYWRILFILGVPLTKTQETPGLENVMASLLHNFVKLVFFPPKKSLP